MFLKKYFEEITFALLLLALSPYIYLSFFAHPAADDYNDIIFRMHSGFWQTCYDQYSGWSGRYFLNLLIWLNPLSFHNFFAYKLMPVLFILFSLASIYYFIRAITKRIFSPLVSFNASLLFLLLYLFLMPSLAQGIYWYSGSATYQASIIFSMLYFGWVADYFFEKHFLSKYFHLLIACVILLVSTGFNEVMTLLLLFFHFVALILFVLKKKKMRIDLLLLSIICLTGALAMALAPGNSGRSSFYPEHHNFFHSLFFTSLQTVRFMFDWISNLPFILSTLLLMVVAVLNKEKITYFLHYNLFKPVAAISVLTAILFICIFPAYWETNILGQQRTVNVACFFFLTGWFLFVLIYSVPYSQYLSPFTDLLRKFIIPTVLLIVFSICFTKNGYNVCTDLVYAKAKQFDREMNDRYKILKDPGNKETIVTVKPLDAKPISLYVLDLEDSTYWVNYYQAKYFGVKSITCKK